MPIYFFLCIEYHNCNEYKQSGFLNFVNQSENHLKYNSILIPSMNLVTRGGDPGYLDVPCKFLTGVSLNQLLGISLNELFPWLPASVKFTFYCNEVLTMHNFINIQLSYSFTFI